jgi:hypothetical protein
MYTLCCFAFSAAFVVAPATICFTGAFSASIQSLLRSEQLALIPPAGCHMDAPKSCPKRAPGMEPILEKGHDLQTESTRPVLSYLAFPMPELIDWLRPEYVPIRAQQASVGANRTPAWTRSAWNLAVEQTSSSEHADWALRSSIPALLCKSGWLNLSGGALLVLVTVLAMFALSAATLRRLFFLEILEERFGARDRSQLPTKRDQLLLVFPSRDALDALIRQKVPTERLLTAKDLAGSPDYPRLDLKSATCVVAPFDPLRRATAENRAEWAEALSRFTEMRGPGTKDALHVRSRANYARQWDESDPDEQRVLAQMAIDGHPSPHPNNGPVLQQLAARGFIDDETLTLEDVAFSEYVRQSVSPDQVNAWQSRDSDVAWSIVRVPLVTTVGIVLSVVAISHPDMASSSALFLPPVAAGLPVALRYVAVLIRGKSAAPTV